MTLRVLGILAIVPFLLPPETHAQSHAPDASACIAALPRSAFTRVGAAIEAEIYDSTAVSLLPAADILTQAVALRMRSIMGGSETVLPEAGSLVDWDNLEGAVVVTAMKDGGFRWRASCLQGLTSLPRLRR